jgi:large subunit ribosomal protein L18Ae
MKALHRPVSKKGPVHAPNNLRGRQFLIYGRALPSKNVPEPKICVAKVFAKNETFARSKFWRLNLKDHKLKRSHGEILKIQEIHEKPTSVARNFGIFLKYRSRTGIHNLFKEFRDVSLKGAVSQMYNEMGGNYHIDAEKVTVINTVELKPEELRVRNPRCHQWNDSSAVAYPLWRKTIRKTNTKYNSVFASNRPTVTKTGRSQ